MLSRFERSSARSSLLRTRMAAALTAALMVSACTSAQQQAPLAGVTRQDPLQVASLSLPDVTDESLRASAPVEDGRIRFAAAPGRLLLVYFGFTSCPDVCPATLVDLRLALQRLPDAAPVDLAFVTVDPERDTPQVLNEYLSFFSETFHAVRTESPEELRAVADAFLARYQVEKDEAGEIEVSHTAVLYAVDSSGQVVVEWPFGTMPEQMADDLKILLEETV